jgi:hypothetical protein
MNRNPVDITVYVPNKPGVKSTSAAAAAGVSTWGASTWGQTVWTSTKPQMKIIKLPAGKLKGRTVYLKFEQTADDVDFDLIECKLIGVIERGHFL